MARSHAADDGRTADETDDAVTITVSDRAASNIEHALKERMIMKLRWAVEEENGDLWEQDYRETAQALRQLLEERGKNTWVTVWEMKQLQDEREEESA